MYLLRGGIQNLTNRRLKRKYLNEYIRKIRAQNPVFFLIFRKKNSIFFKCEKKEYYYIIKLKNMSFLA